VKGTEEMINESLEPTLVRFLAHGFGSLFSSFDREFPELIASQAMLVRELIESDFAKNQKKLDSLGIEGLISTDSGALATLLYRVSHAIFTAQPDHVVLPFLAQFARFRTGTEVYYSTKIGPGFNISHGAALVIGPRHTIGKNFLVHQGVTIGQRYAYSPDESVTVGDDCIFFAGSKVLGTIKVGDGVKLGANAVLLSDAEPYATYAGIPARIVSKRS
jgi:serine O-acetyltransferase